jgi:lipoprotein-anchoring transpeptidase ErfK/SrfK
MHPVLGVPLNLSIASATNESRVSLPESAWKGDSKGGVMHLSRSLTAASAALLLFATMPQLAQARELVGFAGAYSSGTVVVKTSERALYYVLGNGQAVRYPVGVGRAGKQWTGTAMINGKQLSPAWSPPDEVKRDKPSLPNLIPGGSPSNPMGAAAMTLSGGGEYAIHGTNDARSIGGFVSYGCIRMYNADVLDLYNRVSWGTTVVVTR